MSYTIKNKQKKAKLKESPAIGVGKGCLYISTPKNIRGLSTTHHPNSVKGPSATVRGATHTGRGTPSLRAYHPNRAKGTQSWSIDPMLLKDRKYYIEPFELTVSKLGISLEDIERLRDELYSVYLEITDPETLN